MRVAVFQFASCDDIDSNFAKIRKAVAEASEKKVRLLVFHECAACGYPPIELSDVDSIDFLLLETRVREVQELAKTHGMHIVLGIIKKEHNMRYNSLLIISPDGEVIGSYDKRALWGWDTDNFSRGSSLGVVEIDDLVIGFRICFEVRFPEYFRELFVRKADLCFVSFSDVSENELPERYELIKAHLRTRAVENVMTVISVNSLSDYQAAPTAVFDINGNIVSEAPKNEEYLLVFDYSKPEIEFGAKGRIQNSYEAMHLVN